MYLGDILYLIMVIDNAITTAVTHRTVKKILFFHFLKVYKM